MNKQNGTKVVKFVKDIITLLIYFTSRLATEQGRTFDVCCGGLRLFLFVKERI